jgi:hypothetical protein
MFVNEIAKLKFWLDILNCWHVDFVFVGKFPVFFLPRCSLEIPQSPWTIHPSKTIYIHTHICTIKHYTRYTHTHICVYKYVYIYIVICMYNCVYISTTWTPSDSTTRWRFSLLHRSLPLPGGLFNLGGHPSAADPAVAGLGTLATCKRHGETCGNCRSTVFFPEGYFIHLESQWIYI